MFGELFLWLFAIIIFVLISAIYYIYYYWHRNGFPHIRPSFPYGNLSGLGQTVQFAQLLDRFYQQLCQQNPHAQIGGLWFYWRPIALVLNAQLARQILVNDFTTFPDRGMYYNEVDDPLSAHLVSLDAFEWHRLRRKLSPTFTASKMRFMFSTMAEIGERLKVRMSELTDHGTARSIDVYELMGRFTTDVIGSCAFGIECESLTNRNDEFRIMGQRAFADRNLPFQWLFLLTSTSLLGRRAHLKPNKPDVAKFFTSLVADTIGHREQNNIERNDFLDILIQLKNDPNIGLTMNEIAAQAFIFFSAGFDTSSTTLTYALYELARNQTIQTKLRHEIHTILGKEDQKQLTYETLTEMEYLNKIINETLRKHPPIGQIARRASRNYPIPGTDLILPEGTITFIPVFSMNHDPKLYSNPNEFQPDRFNDDGRLNPMETTLAFGDGPRSCIGMRFGMMQVQIGLFEIIGNFRIDLCSKSVDEIRYCKSSSIMSPENGLWLQIEHLDESISIY